MRRDEFIVHQAEHADDKLGFTEGDEEARQRFLRLAIDTYDALTSAGARHIWTFDPCLEVARNALCRTNWGRPGGLRIELAPTLVERWKAWNADYFAIRARQPRLELHDMLEDVSEGDSAASWPAGYEWRLAAWVDAGDPSAPPPFMDRYDIVTPAFFMRLRELRRLCNGWLYWCDGAKSVVYAPEPEWRRVRAEHEAAYARLRRT